MSALRRRRRTVRRESLSHGLIITTMVDMFTLVLLFLLMFYDPMYDGSSPIDLPHAKVQAHAQTGPTISVTPDLISVGGAAVAPLQAGKLLPGTLGGGCCILPLVDSTTRAGRAVIRATGNGVLRPGMYADVRLEATRLANRTIVPASAVIERDGRPLVFVVKGGRAQWVYIFPGRTNGFETEVLADSSSGQIPVAAGDTVLVEGHLTLTHDAPVRLVAKQERGTP